MIRRLPWRNWSLLVAAGFAVFALLALGIALSWRSADQSRLEEGRQENCEAIEQHKSFHRAEAAFNLRETREILREIGINPDSDRGQLLLTRTRRDAKREQARFAPSEC